MRLRSKDITNALLGLFGYRLEPVRAKGPGRLASDPMQAQREILERMGIERPIILDVGASVGETVARYRSLFPRGVVHAFEPFPESVAALTERFGGDDAVVLVPRGVSDRAGKRFLHVNAAPATNSLMPRPSDGPALYPSVGAPVGTIEIETIDLDSYAGDRGIERVGVLKLDIQGGERLAIAGARSLLGGQRVELVYTEIQFVPLYEGAPTFDRVWEDLRTLGYTLVDVHNIHRTPGGRVTYGDALFASRACVERVIDTLETHP